jgi:hypothetical protein
MGGTWIFHRLNASELEEIHNHPSSALAFAVFLCYNGKAEERGPILSGRTAEEKRQRYGRRV